ncbi:MAG TPA: SGNH/GDSL hydrolase family protein [Anaerolineae bacterium]|nr:SGNH/GDSL hydrolase family protein [Anaerolineae bacterium]
MRLTSAQIAQRYPAHIEPLQPDILILQLCINDLKTIPLFPQEKEAIINQCQENIQHIINQAQTSDTQIIISTIFPVGPVPLQRQLVWSDEIPSAITQINTFIHSLANDQIIIFDAYTILANDHGQLADKYSQDELHLNPAGYQALNQQLETLLQITPK